ncbi:MAG: hypothetical protein KDN22_20855 [Verrucomicrobiae bacterium]|nr:hypothetical protein [Verrucomicrobiae bacterium]
MNNRINLTSEQLREAAAIKDQIEALEAKLAGLLSGAGVSAVSAAPVAATPGKRRGRKPGSKNKVKASAESTPSDSAAAPTAKKKAKRQMSPEGRARIIAAQKARWAKAKKGK